MTYTFSSDQLPAYQPSGQELRIHWDAEEVPMPSMDDTPRTQWRQKEALCNIADDYGTLVAKIIRSQMSVDAELATINNGGERYAAYQAFREEAKALAKGYLAQRDATLGVPVEDVSVAQFNKPTPNEDVTV